MKTKIQIRRICDINYNVYDIYDFMRKDNFGRWISVSTYFNLEDAIRWHPETEIEDKR